MSSALIAKLLKLVSKVFLVRQHRLIARSVVKRLLIMLIGKPISSDSVVTNSQLQMGSHVEKEELWNPM